MGSKLRGSEDGGCQRRKDSPAEPETKTNAPQFVCKIWKARDFGFSEFGFPFKLKGAPSSEESQGCIPPFLRLCRASFFVSPESDNLRWSKYLPSRQLVTWKCIEFRRQTGFVHFHLSWWEAKPAFFGGMTLKEENKLQGGRTQQAFWQDSTRAVFEVTPGWSVGEPQETKNHSGVERRPGPLRPKSLPEEEWCRQPICLAGGDISETNCANSGQ